MEMGGGMSLLFNSFFHSPPLAITIIAVAALSSRQLLSDVERRRTDHVAVDCGTGVVDTRSKREVAQTATGRADVAQQLV